MPDFMYYCDDWFVYRLNFLTYELCYVNTELWIEWENQPTQGIPGERFHWSLVPVAIMRDEWEIVPSLDSI